MMPLPNCCYNSGALLLTAALTLLLMPATYFKPNIPLFQHDSDSHVPQILQIAPQTIAVEHDPDLLHLSPYVIILFVGIIVYILERIQRKITERKILKLRQYLDGCKERLRAVEHQQAQLEGTLSLSRRTSEEYDLLLYLLLRHQRPLSSQVKVYFKEFFDFISIDFT